MNLLWLHTLRKVADTGSFTRAAEALFISQPAASQQVRQLERFFGAKLIERAGQESRLTEAGRQVYDLAGRIDLDLDTTRNVVRELVNRSHHLVTIVSASTPLLYYLPRVLGRFWEEFPDAEIRTMVRPSAEIAGVVKSGQADLAIQSNLYLDPALNAVEFADSSLLCVSSPRHAFASEMATPAEEVSRSRVAITPVGTGTRMLVDAWLTERGLVLHNVLEVSTQEEIRTAAVQNLAIGFSSRPAVADDIASGRLVKLNVLDFNLVRRIYVTFREDTVGPATYLVDLLAHLEN